MNQNQQESLEKCVKYCGGGCLGAILAMTLIGFIVIGIIGVVSLPVYLIWNWLFPALFGLPVITYLQSMGLVLICSILFGGASSK